MAETAAHPVDHVFPHVPVRQWVLSVPKRLRPFLLHRFGSSLNPHYHFHLCVVDGLFEGVQGDADPDHCNSTSHLRFHFDLAEPEPVPDHASRGAHDFDQSWGA